MQFHETGSPRTRKAAFHHRIERGEISQPTFERDLAALLGVAPDGLLAGLLGGLEPDRAVIDTAARARAAGIRVEVITNSWGTDPCDPYAGYQLGERYDAVIISGKVGLRKPDPAIYLLSAEKLGLSPNQCVFVDDVAVNLPAVAELGMATVRHVTSNATVRKLDRLFGIGC